MAVAEQIARHTKTSDLVALYGELGTGKTTFARGMAKALGIDPQLVASPTFVIVHEYTPPVHGGECETPVLVHIDGYRLKGLGDLESIGWDQPMSEMRDRSVVLVEWADRFEDQLGDDRLDVHLEHLSQCARSLTITALGSWVDRFTALQAAIEEVVKEPAKMTVTHCPICKEPVAADIETFPFCSKRCKMIDFGRWIDGKYVINRPIEITDVDEGE